MNFLQSVNLKNFLKSKKKMKNQPLKSMTSIQCKSSIISINSNDQKFTKVIFEQNDEGNQISPSFVYKAAMQGCNQVNQQIMEFQEYEEYGADAVNFPKPPVINKQSIEEPKPIKVKITPAIQKLHVNRSKSEHKTSNNKRRILQGSRGKTMTVARFSNKEQQRKRLTSYQHPNKETKSIFKNTNILQLSRFNEKGQNSIRKTVQKKVRLKTNSVTSLSSDIILDQKHNKCIPLQKSRPSQQLEESFWQNAYRLRKCEVPVWYQIQRLWGKAEQKRKSQKRKNNPLPKQNKKILYKGYDFNGELIPSTNLPQKGKKPLEKNSQINIEFFNEDCVENLSNYHERHQRNAKTYKKIKLNPFDCENQESEFLANLQRVLWTKNVEHKRREQKIPQEKEKTSKSIKIDEKNHQQKQQKEKQKVQHEKQDSFNDQIKGQQTKITDKEELIENFDRIKFGHSIAEVNQDNHFPFGFSKYVKVKKFQEKHTKSKSYNFHTVNYFSIPYKDSQLEIPTTLKLKPQPNNSSEKVRANKRLFKQVFNMSLKKIDPQNREDVLTAKLIKDREKQNSENPKNQGHQKKLRRHYARNSDTLLLKKGFCIKPTVFKQIKQNQTNEKIDRKNSLSKTLKSNQTQESIQSKNYKAKTLHQGLLDQNLAQKNYRKSIVTPSSSLNGQNIEKMFKKQTKKTLIKQSAQDFRRQSFF